MRKYPLQAILQFDDPQIGTSDGSVKTVTVGSDGELYINGTKKTGVA